MTKTRRHQSELAERKDLFARLLAVQRATRTWSKNEKLIIVMYYEKGLTMREIGDALNLTESRVCQIHSKVMLELKVQLTQLSRIRDDQGVEIEGPEKARRTGEKAGDRVHDDDDFASATVSLSDLNLAENPVAAVKLLERTTAGGHARIEAGARESLQRYLHSIAERTEVWESLGRRQEFCTALNRFLKEHGLELEFDGHRVGIYGGPAPRSRSGVFQVKFRAGSSSGTTGTTAAALPRLKVVAKPQVYEP